MSIRAQDISEQVSITSVVLASCNTIARSTSLNYIRMYRHNRVSSGHQHINKQARWSLNRNGNSFCRSNLFELSPQGDKPLSIMADLGAQYDSACLVHNTNCVRRTAPIQSGEILHITPQIDGIFRAGRSSGLLTDWRSGNVFPGASSCGLLRLPSRCRAADLMRAIHWPALMAVTATARNREVALLYSAAPLIRG